MTDRLRRSGYQPRAFGTRAIGYNVLVPVALGLSVSENPAASGTDSPDRAAVGLIADSRPAA